MLTVDATDVAVMVDLTGVTGAMNQTDTDAVVDAAVAVAMNTAMGTDVDLAIKTVVVVADLDTNIIFILNYF